MSRRSPSARLSIPAFANTSSSAANSAAVTFTLTAETGIAASVWRSASALSVYWIARTDTPNRSASTEVETPSAASRTISMRFASVRRFVRDMRKKDPLFPATFHQGCPYLTIIYLSVNYILTSHSVSGSLGVRFPRGPQGRGPATSPPGDPLAIGVPLPQHRPRVWTNTHVFGRNRGRAQTPPTGRTGRVKEGQIWASNLCRKNREALADRFLRMAPLRLTGRSVAA